MEISTIFVIDYLFCKRTWKVIFKNIGLIKDAIILKSQNFYLGQQKNLYITFFFNWKYFYVFIFKTLNIVSIDLNRNIDFLYKKKFQSLNKTTKSLFLDGCSSTLEISLVKHVCIFFWSIDIIISNLTKNTLKIFKLKKMFKINIFKVPKI